jgi:hypothetical protein
VLYVSSTKPVRHPVGQVFSDGISAILAAVEANPRIKRPEFAAKILGDQHDAPEAAPRKAQLASDLHYLIHAGHVIEFSNGMLELPLAPQDKSGAAKPAAAARVAAGATAAEATEEIEPAAEGTEAEHPAHESTVTEVGHAEHEHAAAPITSDVHPTPSSEATITDEPVAAVAETEPVASSEAATPASTIAEGLASHAAPESPEAPIAPPETPVVEEHVESVSTVQSSTDVAEAAPVHATAPTETHELAPEPEVVHEPEVEVATNPGSPL